MVPLAMGIRRMSCNISRTRPAGSSITDEQADDKHIEDGRFLGMKWFK
jgi:hypothetical protein